MSHTTIPASRVLPGMKTFRFLPSRWKNSSLCLVAMGVFICLFILPLSASAYRGVAISYLADETSSLTIDAVSSPEKAGEYRGYVPSFMAFSRLPGTFNGAIWLRFTFAASFEKPVSALYVDLGPSLPGIARLFIPQKDGTFTVMANPPHQGIFTLPDTQPFPETLYARIDGIPGLWFSPLLGPVEEAPQTPPLHFILAGLFSVAMLLLLIQYVRKAEEWRLWAAITAGCGIVGAILPSTPVAGMAYTPLMAVAMLVPGLILIFFVHTTRHIFNSPTTIPGYDKILLLLYPVSAAIALLPLFPGLLWTARFLPFAAITLLPLLPIGMVALARSLRGCSVYFCASLLPIFGVAASAWELTATGTSLINGTGSLWGVGLAMLVLSVIPPTKPQAQDMPEEDIFDSLNSSAPLTLQNSAFSIPEAPLSDFAEPHLSPEPEAPASLDTNKSEQAQADEFPSLSLFGSVSSAGEPEKPLASSEPAIASIAEPLLPIPDSALSSLSMHSFREEQEETPAESDDASTSFPSAATVQPEPAGQDVPADILEAPLPFAATVTEPSSPPVLTIIEDALEENQQPPLSPHSASDPFHKSDEKALQQNEAGSPDAIEQRWSRKSIFDLSLLIKNIHDALSPLADEKKCTMTWYIAPQTGQLFEGEAERLESALQHILRDMIESAEQGNVRLSIRRLPDSLEAGHIVFTITGSDAKQIAPHERNIEGHAEAWSLAEKTGGIFSVEHSPNSTTVVFSAIFITQDKDGKTETEREVAPSLPNPVRSAHPDVAETQKETKPVVVFTDYPDVSLPPEFEEAQTAHITATEKLSGIDADGLADSQNTDRIPDRLIIVDIAASGRARLAGVFANTPYAVLECTSPSDACAMYLRHPSAGIIMNADMPEVDILSALEAIHTADTACGRPAAFSVAIVGYTAQANRLLASGFSRTVLKAQMDDELLSIVKALAPLPFETQAEPDAPEVDLPTLETHIGTALAELPPMESVENTPESSTPQTALPELPAVEETSPMQRESAIFDSILPPSEPEKETSPEPAPLLADSATETDSASPISGMGLLDMIITDEKEAASDDLIPVSKADTSPPSVEKAAVPPPAPAPKVSAEAVPPKRKHSVTVKVNPVRLKSAASTTTSQNAEPATPAVPATTAPTVEQDNTATQESLKEAIDVAAVIEPVLATSIPLPGEEDSVFKDMVPLIPGLILDLDDAVIDALKGNDENSPLLVEEAAGRIAGKAENFGLVRLEHLSRCVERAAAANDAEATECVLADLKAWVDRYKVALQKLHQETLW